MSNSVVSPNTEIEESFRSKYTFGFWAYIMTDCLLFATLFATYAVLRNNIAEGPSSQEIFSINYVLVETILLLISSLTSGLTVLSARVKRSGQTIVWMAVTFILGLGFVTMEILEFSKLYNDNISWQTSAFLSSYFTLVGTHGLHIIVGLIWLLVLAGQVLSKSFTPHVIRRLTNWGLFWHFLDIIWIFIFSVVYLMGVS